MMLGQNKGAIVNTASVAGLVGFPNIPACNASKVGGSAEAEAQFVALEPVGRMGLPDEVAEAVVWLCSDAASFVTGDAMPVDGGLVAH